MAANSFETADTIRQLQRIFPKMAENCEQIFVAEDIAGDRLPTLEPSSETLPAKLHPELAKIMFSHDRYYTRRKFWSKHRSKAADRKAFRKAQTIDCSS